MTRTDKWKDLGSQFRLFAFLWIGIGVLCLLGLSPLSNATTWAQELVTGTLGLSLGFALLVAHRRLFASNGSSESIGLDAWRGFIGLAIGAPLALGIVFIRWHVRGDIGVAVFGAAVAVFFLLLVGSPGFWMRRRWGWWATWTAFVLMGTASYWLFRVDLNPSLRAVEGAFRVGVGLALGTLNGLSEPIFGRPLGAERWLAPLFAMIGGAMVASIEGGWLIVGLLLFYLFFVRAHSVAVQGLLEPFARDGEPQRL